MQTLWILLAALVAYLALWVYFDASRQRDAYHIGRGPRDLPPNTWSALVFFFAPIAFPLYWKSRENVPLEASPRLGAPPVFESRGLNVYGWLAGFLFLGAASWLLVEQELLLAATASLLGMIAVFGGRTILATDRAVRLDLPANAAWEQVGFRPLPREEDQADDEDPEEHVVNLDRLPSPAAAGRPAAPAAPYAPPASHPPAPAAPPGPPVASALPAAPAWPPAAPAIPAVPAVTSFPPPLASAPPSRPAPRPESSVRISDITWAASEDDFDDGSSDPAPPLPGARGGARVATADPALFQQLGGVFAPPGGVPPGAAGPPRPMPPAAPHAVPPPVAPPSPFAAPSAAPPPVSPIAAAFAPPPPAAAGPAPAAPSYGPPGRPAPIGGAYAAARPAPGSRLPLILGTIAALALLGGLGWYFATRPETVPAEPAPVEAAADPVPADSGEVGDPAVADGDPGAAQEGLPLDESTGDPPAAGGAAGDTAGDDSAADDQLAAARQWMALYVDRFGPVGQILEEIDYEGFSPVRCESLRINYGNIGEMPLLPDEQLQFRVSGCMVQMSDLAADCDQKDTAIWCAHLIATRTCLHEMQLELEARWGLPGLLEFQISDTEPRSTDSMTGRCIAEENLRRSKIVEP